MNHVYHDYLERTGVGELLYYINLQRGYPETKQFAYDVFDEEIAYIDEFLGMELPDWRANRS